MFLTLLFLLTTASFGQSKFEQTLTGKWIARCVPQENLNRSLTISDLCPHSIDPEQPNKAEFKTLQITFEKEFIQINRNNKITSVKYIDNTESNGFSFTLEDRPYTFKVYSDGEKVILVEKSGVMLILERTK